MYYFMGNPSQSCRASPAIWDHTVLPTTRHSLWVGVVGTGESRGTGPSRATVGPKETFSWGPQTFFHGAPLGRKFLNFSFQNGTFWRTLYLWLTAGPPNVAGPGVANPLTPPSRWVCQGINRH